MRECEEKYKLNEEQVQILLAPYLEEKEDFFLKEYSIMMVGFVDYCWYHEVDMLKTPSIMTPEERIAYHEAVAEENKPDIASFEFSNTSSFIDKGDTKSLYHRTWMSSNVFDTYSLLLNIRNVKENKREAFFFPTECFVSIDWNNSKPLHVIYE